MRRSRCVAPRGENWWRPQPGSGPGCGPPPRIPSEPQLSAIGLRPWQKRVNMFTQSESLRTQLKGPQAWASLGPQRESGDYCRPAVGPPLPGQHPAHRPSFPSTGLPPVPHKSPWSCHTPPASCSTWALRVATCSQCSCQPSAHWRSRPSAQTLCCSGEPRAPRGGRSLVMPRELIVSLLGSL